MRLATQVDLLMTDRAKALQAAEASNQSDATSRMAVNSNLQIPLMLTAGPTGGMPPPGYAGGPTGMHPGHGGMPPPGYGPPPPGYGPPPPGYGGPPTNGMGRPYM